MTGGVGARFLLVAMALFLLLASAASALRGQDQRLRRLHLPPAPASPSSPAPAPAPAPAPPAQPSPDGGTEPAPQPPPVPPTTPPPLPPLPRSLAVDETEYSIGLSRTVVGTGEVTFNVYNRGMDDHDLAVVDANGTTRIMAVPPRETRSLVVTLAAGRVKLYCSLFAGTPGSHEALGMSTTIEVR